MTVSWNWAVRPKLQDVLGRIKWADTDSRPPLVDIGDGETLDVYTFLALEGFAETPEEIDRLGWWRADHE